MAHAPRAQVGALIVIYGHRLGERSRTAEVLDVLGTAEPERHYVRWDDGRERIFTLGSDALIRPARHPEDEPALVHKP